MNTASTSLAPTAPSAPPSRNPGPSGRATPRDGEQPFSSVLDQAMDAPAVAREEARKGKPKEAPEAANNPTEPAASVRPPDAPTVPTTPAPPATTTVVSAEAIDSTAACEDAAQTAALTAGTAPTSARLSASALPGQAAAPLSVTPFAGAPALEDLADTATGTASARRPLAGSSATPLAASRNDTQATSWAAPDTGTPAQAAGLAPLPIESSTAGTAMTLAAAAASAAEALPTATEPKLTPELGVQGVNLLTTEDTAASPVYRATLVAHPQHSAFPAELGTQVKFLMASGLQQAELHLNPAELGPIRIQLNMVAQTADLSFTATHNATRESILQALPALRDMLASQGLNLGQAGLSSGQGNPSFTQPGQQGPQRRAGSHDDGPLPVGHQGVELSAQRPASQRMLDMYA